MPEKERPPLPPLLSDMLKWDIWSEPCCSSRAMLLASSLIDRSWSVWSGEFVLGPLLRGGADRTPLPVDGRDLRALARRRREAVEQPSRCHALDRPLLFGGDDRAFGRAVVERQVLLAEIDRAGQLPLRLRAAGQRVSSNLG